MAVFTHNASTQKALLHNNKIYYYSGTGLRNYLSVSNLTDELSWTDYQLNGLACGLRF
jgi:hypothetical protein